MPDVQNGVNHVPSAASAHSRHDRLLVARFAAADAYPGEAEEARALVERCAECARLADDIRLLRASTAQLEAPGRPRDFRLTSEQAERLRGSALERALRRLAAPGLAPLRPLAGVAMSIGLVMAVAGVALPTPAGSDFMPMSGRELRVQDDDAPPADGAPGAPALPEPDARPVPVQAPPVDEHEVGAGGEVSEPEGAELGAPDEDVVTRTDDFEQQVLRTNGADDPTRVVLFYGGIAIAALSLAVLLLVIVARRRMSDPLLR